MSNYNPVVAKLCAQASLDAYQNCSITKADDCELLTSNGTQCLVERFGNLILVAFRGTENAQDFRTDLDFDFATPKYNGVKIHDGFLKAWGEIDQDILKCIARMTNWKGLTDYKVYVTGHSMGGALAILFAYFAKDIVDVDGIYTFGCPRVGNKDFAQKYSETFEDMTFRFINNNDVVPKLPPSWVGYRHVGHEVYFDRKGRHVANYSGYWGSLWDRVMGRFRDIPNLTPDGINDHSMKNYLELLK